MKTRQPIYILVQGNHPLHREPEEYGRKSETKASHSIQMDLITGLIG